ncbi:MAG: response regulator [Spirochaetes bacterium]|nr:response regulator [Spirochaetota bacterium]
MKRVLVIEDNESNRYMIRCLLEQNGFEIVEAVTGEGGVEAAARERFDLIIMDIQLPDINGLEATRRIRQSSGDGDVPIIAVTSYAMTGDKTRAFDAGCTAYIEKPIEPDKFIKHVKKYIKLNKKGTQP